MENSIERTGRCERMLGMISIPKIGIKAKLFADHNGSRPSRQFYRNTPTLQSWSSERKKKKRKTSTPKHCQSEFFVRGAVQSVSPIVFLNVNLISFRTGL